jgi:hypothetical protein
MHRHWLHRVFATLLVAWFAALTAEPVTLHPCPMHDGVLLLQTSAAAHHAMHGAMSAHDAPMEHAAAHEDLPPAHSTGHHQCTCIGTCTATSATGLPSARLALAATLDAPVHDPGLPDYAYVPVAAQHVLPFAHAPPQQG